MGEPIYDFGSTLVAEAVAAASITASTAGTAITIVTGTSDHTYGLVTSDLDQAVWVTYGGVKAFRLPAGVSTVIDLREGNRRFKATKVVGVYHDGVQPTTGKIAVTLS